MLTNEGKYDKENEEFWIFDVLCINIRILHLWKMGIHVVTIDLAHNSFLMIFKYFKYIYEIW